MRRIIVCVEKCFAFERKEEFLCQEEQEEVMAAVRVEVRAAVLAALVEVRAVVLAARVAASAVVVVQEAGTEAARWAVHHPHAGVGAGIAGVDTAEDAVFCHFAVFYS